MTDFREEQNQQFHSKNSSFILSPFCSYIHKVVLHNKQTEHFNKASHLLPWIHTVNIYLICFFIGQFHQGYAICFQIQCSHNLTIHSLKYCFISQWTSSGWDDLTLSWSLCLYVGTLMRLDSACVTEWISLCHRLTNLNDTCHLQLRPKPTSCHELRL